MTTTTKVADIDVSIDYASDDSGELQLWARGHHDKGDFLAACAQKLRTWGDREDNLDSLAVTQQHWRTVRASAEIRSHGVCDGTVHVRSEPGRGAYAVTVLDWLPLFISAKTPCSA